MNALEQFLFAMDENGIYQFIKSPGVTSLLSDASLQYLRQKQHNNNEPYWLPTEQCVAVQYIDHVKDGDNRDGVWNHTLLIPIDEYIRRTGPYKLFSKHFIRKGSPVPATLEPVV